LKKVRVWVLVDWYAPGFKAGGPIRSAVNFSDQLEHELDIWVLTSDRDLGDNVPYENIPADQWVGYKDHRVYYASPSSMHWRKILELIREARPDYIYINSMFSRYYSVYPMLMKKMGLVESKVVLAPRGMLKDSALLHKSAKKKIFLGMYRFLGIHSKVIFQATDDTEEKDIMLQFGKKVKIFKAGNLPGSQPVYLPPEDKVPGEIKIIFIGRIHPIKNIDFLLGALQNIHGRVELTVIATLEDKIYWNHCQEIIKNLPSNISVQFLQDLPHENITGMIQQHHIFALPTQGENFGHSVFESLAAGRPVLISDQTPWRNLTSVKAGWDISLADRKAFENKIIQVLNMNNSELSEWCRGAWDHAHAYLHTSPDKQSYLKQFS
jgi:glycosyltransferase involved in cell wall biosynthesis